MAGYIQQVHLSPLLACLNSDFNAFALSYYVEIYLSSALLFVFQIQAIIFSMWFAIVLPFELVYLQPIKKMPEMSSCQGMLLWSDSILVWKRS